MKIFTTLIFILLNLQYVFPAEETQEGLENIRKGDLNTRILCGSDSQTKISQFELCSFGGTRLEGKVIFTDPPKKKTKLCLEAKSRSGKKIQYYEVENYNIDPTTNDKETQENLKKICDSFKVEEVVVRTALLFKIKFFYKGEWWCDVYESYEFKFKEIGKCEEVEDGYAAMMDMEYNSVDTQAETMNKLGSVFWKPCSAEEYPEETLCTDKDTDITTKTRFFCQKNIKGMLGYKVVNYEKGLEIASYTLSNSENLRGKVDSHKVCRLFRFAKDSKGGKKILVRYLNYNTGWRCQQFLFKTNKGSKSHYSMLQDNKCDNLKTMNIGNGFSVKMGMLWKLILIVPILMMLSCLVLL